MDEIRISIAKLAGIRKAVGSLLAQTEGRGGTRPISYFMPVDCAHHFKSAANELSSLRRALPSYYGDFVDIPDKPAIPLGSKDENGVEKMAFGRDQLSRLAQDIDQIFEIRAHSELSTPSAAASIKRRVFLSHGRAADWREVQAYIERDVGLPTLELAQEPNQGRTILEKLVEESEKCDCAAIVMTGDDLDKDGQAKARENVIHEIGFFQGKYGLNRIVLLHEDGVNIPSNIHGVVYTPFPKGLVGACFGLLARELKAMY